jgi:hypothetical protein
LLESPAELDPDEVEVEVELEVELELLEADESEEPLFLS